MKFSSKIEACGLSPMRVFNGIAADAEKRGIKIYHLNIGQPDIKTPAAYYEALKNFDAPVLEYAPSPGVPELLDAVKGYYANIGIDLDRSSILPMNGGSEAYQAAFACVLDDGDEVIIPEPYYPNYHTAVTLTGGKIHPLTTCAEEGYFYADRARVEACINEHTRAIVITNPGNPTGAVLTQDQLKLMLDIAKEHDLFIICDEVYREFTYNGEPLHSALQFPGYEENIVIIDSVSKRFSACGARVGLLVSKNAAFMQQAMKWAQCRLASSTVDQLASAALYSTEPSYFEDVRVEYKKRRDAAFSRLEKMPGVVCHCPDGAFYMMAALPVDDSAKFQTWLLNEFNDNGETVMFSCGEPFYGTPGLGKNEIRIAYVLNADDVARAMDILGKALVEYNKLQK
ncbi:MAG: pyridoxal phosphate-dependent aminotransferase [Oscillospiraceae bacterium]|nr:pyridoxal phosphate-dependent aminotransferase [Oscillospiraceae bacterium]